MWEDYIVEDQIKITALHSFFEFWRRDRFAFLGESHNFWECVYVQAGAVCVVGDDRVYAMREGDLIFHKPLELHKFTVDHADGATLLVFSFSIQGPLADHFKNKLFALSAEQKALLSASLALVREQTPAPDASLKRCEISPSFLQRLSLQLTELLLDLYDHSTPAAPAAEPNAAVFSKAVGLMTSNLDKSPDVAQIARYCHVSEAGLKRIFRNYAGQAVHRYHTMLKINAAKELLAEGMQVSEVAERLGFSSPAYFSYAFRRETGKTPRCWRSGAERS